VKGFIVLVVTLIIAVVLDEILDYIGQCWVNNIEKNWLNRNDANG
jgi:antibiotic biosynthesis monooxygenase (ABM) superfamily enzyme